MDAKVLAACKAAFEATGDSLTLGAPLYSGQCAPEPLVRVPLAMMNRHGLIAGATGTGKTKTLQLMAEQLSTAGVPVFLADMKGICPGWAPPGRPIRGSSSAPRTPAGSGRPRPSRSSS